MTGALVELHDACKREGLHLALDLIGPTGHRARDQEVAGYYTLRLRALLPTGDVVAGRCQSEPGREPVDELATGVVNTLRAKGLIA